MSRFEVTVAWSGWYRLALGGLVLVSVACAHHRQVEVGSFFTASPVFAMSAATDSIYEDEPMVMWASAGTSPGLGGYVSDADLDLIVVHVLSVSDVKATIARPPRVTLEVERVLRGRLLPGTLEALWVMDQILPHCGNMTAEEQAAELRYYTRRVRGPRPGKKFILAGVHGDDSLWRALPQVRLAYDEKLANQIFSQAQTADSTKAMAAFLERQRQAAQDASDTQLRESANLGRLVRASTDIVVARIRRNGLALTIEQLLYEAPRDSIAQGINASVPEAFLWGDAGMRLRFEGPESAVSRLLDRAGATSEQESSAIPGIYLCFLRRRGLSPEDGGFYPMVPADATAGVLPADPELISQVRRIIAVESQKGPWSPLPPPQCGVPWSRLSQLRAFAPDSLLIRILDARVRNYSGRRQSFIFGVGLKDNESPFIPFCDPCGDCFGDQLNRAYAVPLRPAAISTWIRALGTIPPRTLAADSAVAIVTVCGGVGNNMRCAEQRLSARDLARAAEALTRAVAADTVAAWRVNYWKYSFGDPLTPERGWRLAGR